MAGLLVVEPYRLPVALITPATKLGQRVADADVLEVGQADGAALPPETVPADVVQTRRDRHRPPPPEGGEALGHRGQRRVQIVMALERVPGLAADAADLQLDRRSPK